MAESVDPDRFRQPKDPPTLTRIDINDPRRFEHVLGQFELEPIRDWLLTTERRQAGYWDLDSYIRPLLDDSFEPDLVKATSGSMGRNISLIHFLLRSTFLLGDDAPQELRAHYTQWSIACLRKTTSYAAAAGAAAIPTPGWIDAVHKELLPSLVALRQQDADVEVEITLEPRITARAFPDERRIEISAYAREHFRTMNLLVANVVLEVLSGRGTADSLAEIDLSEQILNLIFATYHRAVNFSGLPIPRVSNPMALQIAMRCAHTQVLFLLAHELGHVVADDRRPGLEEELRADRFAFEIIAHQQHELGETYIGLRWLFHYLAIEQAVTSVLSGYPVDDWADMPVRQRDGAMYTNGLKEWRATEFGNAVENIGTFLLMDTKYRIQAEGPAGLRARFTEFKAKFGEPGAPP